MGIFFKGSEIVEAAVKIEENGYDFYHLLANSATEEKVKDVFLSLAEEEKKHIKSFQNLLSSIKSYQAPEEEEEYLSYLQDLADMNVFTEKNAGKEMAGKAKNELEAITLAMGFERDSILFFYEIKDIVEDSEKKVINELIDQEKTHLRRLAKLKKTIKGDK